MSYTYIYSEEASEEVLPEEEPIEDFPEDEDTPSIETYQYIRKPVLWILDRSGRQKKKEGRPAEAVLPFFPPGRLFYPKRRGRG